MKTKNYFSLILLLFVVCVGFTSCSDDDNDDPQTSVSQIIIGEWDSEFLGRMSYDEVEELDLNDKTISKHYMYFTFNSNGRGYDIYYNGDRSDWDWEIIEDVLYTSDGDKYEIVKFNKNVIYLLRQNSYEAGIKLVKRK